MIKTKHRKTGKTLYLLYPGEHFATREDCVIGTITGSCVAVCLYDTLRQIGGMGHFIVPGTIGTEAIYKNDMAYHGINSMELIIGEIVKQGGDRKNLRAKIFGAAFINDIETRLHGVSLNVMKFLHEYFTLEKIPVESDDLSGNHRRKIYFYPTTGKAFRKLLNNNNDSSEFIKLEREYIDSAFMNKNTFGKVVLFE